MIFTSRFQLTAIALACATLAACGGGGGGGSGDKGGRDGAGGDVALIGDGYQVSGTITGLAGGTTLVKKVEGSEESLEVSSNGRFAFRRAVPDGESFEVKLSAPPVGQKCVTSNAFGTIKAKDFEDVSISCATLGSKSSISGTLTAAAGTAADSDLNDPRAPYSDNGDISKAQRIPSQVTVHGFASYAGTKATENNDRFADSYDEFDFFEVELQANQLIQLQVVDYNKFEVETTYEGDLDLILMDAQGNVIGKSESETEFEELVVPSDGRYYVAVEAYSGISKYVLRISQPSSSLAYRATTAASMDFVPNEAIVKFKSGVMSQFSAPDGRVIPMTLKHQDTSRATLATMDRSTRMKSASAGVPAGEVLLGLKSLNPEAYEKFMTLRDIKAMRLQGHTEYAEPNYIRRSQAVPNDKLYGYQWHYPQINLQQAWDITTGESVSGTPVIVAVVDTGLFLDHPDFQGKLVPGYDSITNLENARDGDGPDFNPDDPGDSADRGGSSFHGSHVGGTIAARTNDNYGGAGISWDAKIMPIRALGLMGGSTYDIIQGVRFAAGLSNDSESKPARRADIINLSLGGPNGTLAEQNEFMAVYNAGVIIVASAGNDGSSVPSFPASYNGVISVGAANMKGEMTRYSNFGQFIDLAAPGGDVSVDENGDGVSDGVVSAKADDTSGSRAAAWDSYQGTSMAAPHVAGVIALMKAVHPGLTPAEVDTLISNGELTNDMGVQGWDERSGYGLIDAHKAVLAAQNLANGGGGSPSPTPRVVASPNSISFDQSARASFTIANMGSGSPGVTGLEVNATWLSVTAGQVDGSGFGEYTAYVNRSGLANGAYQASITVSLDTGSQLVIPVTVQVGASSAGGSMAQQYVLLFEAGESGGTFDTIVQTVTPQISGGTATYSFENVPVGDYYVVSGSDLDNDGFVCQSGESCGAHPVIGRPEPVNAMGSPVEGIDFTIDLVGGVSSQSVGSEGSKAPTGYQRGTPELNKQLQQ
ncbi:S8 family serine peptidase [Allohahella sp. A8]|uniref:S8 family serine peptidase n=1 Tax=Allohahella sp. A8 TaxID=3141461 RepID=UPI003A803C30